jgi:tetratricopeptide (TPR) repeat protein
MSQATQLLDSLSVRWDPGQAQEIVRDLNHRMWKDGGRKDPAVPGEAERLSWLIHDQLGRAADLRIRLRLLGLEYQLQQGIARRERAFEVALQAQDLADRLGDRVLSVQTMFQTAKAWFWICRYREAVQWSCRGMQAGRELEAKGQANRPVKQLLASEEVFLAVRQLTIGEPPEEVEGTITHAVERWKAIDDKAGLAMAYGFWSEIRMVQGRWADSVKLARQCLSLAGYPQTKTGAAYGLWTGGFSASRLGDLEMALAWASQAEELCRNDGDISGISEALFSKAITLCQMGRDDESLTTADEAVEVARVLDWEIITRLAMLERSWVQLAAGEPSVTEMQVTAEYFQQAHLKPLEAEAWYALSHRQAKAGQEGQLARQRAVDMFEGLDMHWHAEKARQHEPLVSRPQ